MNSPNTRFTETVLRKYQGRGSVSLSEHLQASGELQKSGHPQFMSLGIGEKASCPISSLFLDLSKFTWRSFWDDPTEVADLADAVLTGFTQIVHELGGHVLGLRGDGLFAGFGPTKDPAFAVAAAGMAAAYALDATNNYLNPRLASMGLEPVIARAGLDYGEVTFIRSGIRTSSEVNVVGFTTNFAAKCEKIAKAWEVVAGEGFITHVSNPNLAIPYFGSPKSYSRDGVKKFYSYYDYKWRAALPEIETSIAELDGRPLELTGF